jgi:hypothetical protein
MIVQKEDTPFDFEEFKNQALADLKAGKPMWGKEGIFTPLMKQF